MKLIIDIPQGMVDAFSHEEQWTALLCKDMNTVLQNGTPYEEQSKDKWIPVSERLPEENGVYLVTLEYVDDSEIVNEINMAWFMYSEKDDSNNGFHKAYPITAWQPLPEPYER